MFPSPWRVLIAQGRLREAMGIYRQGAKLAAEHAPLVLRGVADMHVGMSELLREHNDLVTAQLHLQTSSELGQHAGLPQHAYRSRVALARVRQAEGDLASAKDLLDEAERVYTGDYSPDVRPVAALRARVHLNQGNRTDALGWAHERHLSATDTLSYVHEFEHITLARVLLNQHTTERADGPRNEATRLLERLLGQRAHFGPRICASSALVGACRRELP